MYPAQQLLGSGSAQVRTSGWFFDTIANVATLGLYGRYFLQQPPSEADTLQEHATRSLAEGVCAPGTLYYDPEACAHLQNPDILMPESDEEMSRKHYSRATTRSERCAVLDWPMSSLCRLNAVDESGEWNATLTTGLKIVAAIAAVGVAVKTASVIASLFKSAE